MLKIIIICCLLLSINTFSQNLIPKSDSVHVPTSIFIFNTDDILNVNNQRIGNYLPLTGFKFLSTNRLFQNYFITDIKNIGRKITLDDLIDAHQKLELNKYFFKGYNMWDISLQKQYNQKNN